MLDSTSSRVNVNVPVLPLMKNLQEYGIKNQVDDILLNKNEVDFRDTMWEIVRDYPYTRM